MENIKAVFIDIDNTLLSFDAYVKNTLESGFERFNLGEYNAERYEIFETENEKLWRRLEKGELDLDTLRKTRWNIIFAKMGIAFDGVEFESYFRSELYNSAIVIDGVVDLLEYLYSKYTLYAASNGPYQQQVHRMEIADLAHYFKAMFISENVGYSKPSKEFFDICFKDSDLRPEQCVIIGDSLTSDIQGGVNYGMHTIYYDPKQKGISQDIHPDITIHSLSEISNIL